jgi:hypothetical protein
MNSFTASVLMHSAAVGVIACLISESEVAAPLRDRFKWRVLLCPVCLGFWLATPALGHGPLYYLLVVGASNAWMLVILKVYESLESS